MPDTIFIVPILQRGPSLAITLPKGTVQGGPVRVRMKDIDHGKVAELTTRASVTKSNVRIEFPKGTGGFKVGEMVAVRAKPIIIDEKWFEDDSSLPMKVVQ